MLHTSTSKHPQYPITSPNARRLLLSKPSNNLLSCTHHLLLPYITISTPPPPPSINTAQSSALSPATRPSSSTHRTLTRKYLAVYEDISSPSSTASDSSVLQASVKGLTKFLNNIYEDQKYMMSALGEDMSDIRSIINTTFQQHTTECTPTQNIEKKTRTYRNFWRPYKTRSIT